MNETTPKRHNNRRNTAAAVVALFGLSAALVSGTNSPKQAVKHPYEGEVATPDQYAKTMQDVLNKGEVFTGATMLLKNEFDVKKNKQAELGIDRIYAPIVMTGGKYAYADVDQKTGKVSIHLVDMQDGSLIQPDTTGKLAPFVGGMQVQTPYGGEGLALAVPGPLQDFVGQAVPHSRN